MISSNLATRWARHGFTVLALSALAAPGRADDAKPAVNASEAKAGVTYRVPYQLTDTKHVMVRLKFNGKGPFNFIMDTGAPALFVSTDAAKKAGISADKTGWGSIETMDIEGGATLKDVKARVEDPFQLKGMNSLNLAGLQIDGMMGYTILAQFKIKLDLAKNHMQWTKIDWKPPDPVGLAEGGAVPPEVSGMGAIAGFLQMLVRKRPTPILVQRGFAGVELVEENNGLVVKSVIPESPAAAAGMQAGDQLTKFAGEDVKNMSDLHKLVVQNAEKKKVEVAVQRAGKVVEVNLELRKGL